MRFRLRTLLIVLAVAPPIIAWFWFNREWFVVASGFSVLVAFFWLWLWMVRKTGKLGPGARGSKKLDRPAYKEWN